MSERREKKERIFSCEGISSGFILDFQYSLFLTGSEWDMGS